VQERQRQLPAGRERGLPGRVVDTEQRTLPVVDLRPFDDGEIRRERVGGELLTSQDPPD